MLTFVSHTHADQWLAREIVDMIEGRFQIPAKQLRCTSLPGYQLKLGDTPEDVLKSELGSAAFVIGLLTASSLESSWVISELGATWGLNRKLGLLLFPGVGDDHIPSLFRNLVSVDLRGSERGPHEFSELNYTKERLRFLLDEIGTATQWTTKSGTNTDEFARKFIDRVCMYDPRLRSRELLVTRRQMLDQKAYGMRWAQIAAYAQTEIYIWGWSCMNVLNGNSRIIFQNWLNASENRRLRVLFIDPDGVDASQLDFGPVCGIEHVQVQDDIRGSIATFQQWKDSPQIPASQIDLLKTNLNLTFSGVAVDIGPDAESSDGIIQAEYYTYSGESDHLDKRPNIILRQGSRYWEGQHKTIKTIFDSGAPV